MVQSTENVASDGNAFDFDSTSTVHNVTMAQRNAEDFRFH